MFQGQPPDWPTLTDRAAVTPSAGAVIRPMGPGDAGQVLAVYQAGLDTGLASFETTAPGWEAFDAAKLPGHRFIAADGDGDAPYRVPASTVPVHHSRPCSRHSPPNRGHACQGSA